MFSKLQILTMLTSTMSKLFMTRIVCRGANMSRCTMSAAKLFSTNIDTSIIMPHIQSSYPVVLDLTLGGGGTAKDLLTSTSSKVVGLDCDPKCIQTISKLQEEFGERFTGYLGKWSDLPMLLNRDGVELGACDAVIMDMGVSTNQVLDKDRGFSMEGSGVLDMRFSMEGLTCEQILRSAELESLSKILKVYGGVLKSRTVARDILERKFMMEEIETTDQLLEVLQNSHDRDEFWEEKGENLKHENIKKVFLGLRMFVNNELNEMEFAIRLAEVVLSKGGVLVCGVGSQVEQSLVTKFIFRKSATVGNVEEGRAPVVHQLWELVEGTSLEMEEGGTRLIFRKC